MENFSDNGKMVPDFRDDPRPSLLQQLGGNLLVPIGIVMTVGCYAVGLSSLATGQPMFGQKMMYARVAFQGMTVASMFYDQWLLDRKTKDHINNDVYCDHRYNLQSLSLRPPTN